jgi:hypothetical protein
LFKWSVIERGKAMMRNTMLLVSACLLLGACHRSSEPAATATATAPPPATIDAGKLQMQSGTDLSVPEDFPKDVFLPTGQTIQKVVRVGPTTSLVFGSDQAAPTLMKDIESSMASQGWKTTMSMQTGGQGSMQAYSKPGRSVVYTLSMAGGHPQLTLQHMQETK